MVAENTETIIEKPSRPQDANLIPWKPGQSGNPGGRPKGLASLVREETKDGKELVEVMLKIVRGELTSTETYLDKKGQPHEVVHEPAPRDKIEAVKWLADRGFGKVMESIEVTSPDGLYQSVVILMAQALAKGDVKEIADGITHG